MTINHDMAGAASAYAFLDGAPRMRTRAEFTAGFRETVEDEIERLIGLLDAIDDDREDDSEDNEASLGWANEITRGLRDDGTHVEIPSGLRAADLEFDVADVRHDDGDDDEDGDTGIGDGDALDIERETARTWSFWQSSPYTIRRAADDMARRAATAKYRGRRSDPDEIFLIGPGCGITGARFGGAWA